MVQTAAGQVGQQGTEGDTHQQQGLELLNDAQIQQQAAHQDHDDLPPIGGGQVET